MVAVGKAMGVSMGVTEAVGEANGVMVEVGSRVAFGLAGIPQDGSKSDKPMMIYHIRNR